jgi:hypothetical protein
MQLHLSPVPAFLSFSLLRQSPDRRSLEADRLDPVPVALTRMLSVCPPLKAFGEIKGPSGPKTIPHAADDETMMLAGSA